MTSLVLVENETTYGGQYDHWLDKTGESYQFPNQYRNKVRTGTRFVYYRGVRRENGRRGNAEYFGIGRVGSVWRDPAVPLNTPRSKWRWFCSIDGFHQFPTPVPSKVHGAYLESISNSMGWRTGVREIPDETFERILELAGVPAVPSDGQAAPVPTGAPLPLISEVSVVEEKGKWSTIFVETSPQESAQGGQTESVRRSQQAKRLGDRAEEIVLNWLRSTLQPTPAATVAWLAKQGKTPGWDIEFVDDSGHRISVEVKGTTAANFRSFDVTAQEWAAARTRRQNYWLVLVTECASTTPHVVVIPDPHALLKRGELRIQPVVWRLRRSPVPPPEKVKDLDSGQKI